MAYAQGYTYNRGTGQVDKDPSEETDRFGQVSIPIPGGSPGQVHDGLSYGGYAATVGPDGNVDYSHNGLNDAVNRYQSMGQAAAGRQAARVNFDRANNARQGNLEDRQTQLGALALQRNAAMGNAPSRAEIMGAQAGGQSLEAALGASAGARGMGAVAAQSQAQHGMSGMQLGSQQQAMGGRSAEMSHAIGAYGAGATHMRAGDYQMQGMDQQQADAQARAEITQRQLNQAKQMGYEGLAFNARQAQLAANQKQQETDAGIYGNNLQIQNQEKNRGLAYLGAGYQAGGAGVAGLSNMMNGGGGGGGGSGSGGGMPLRPPSNYGGGDISRDDPYGGQDDGADPYGGIGR